MLFKVTFEIDAPDTMTAEDIKDVLEDAIAEEDDRNREDPQHPDFWISSPRIERIS